MLTIAILNQKGGSGKSTLAECLAVAAHLDGQASAVLDMDPQGTVYAWGKRREEPNPPVRSVTIANLRDEWEVLRDAGADIIIIDTPARLNDWAMQAAELADLVIVPAKPTIKDLERVEASIKLAQVSRAVPALVVLNQVRAQGDRADQAEELIRSQTVPVCPTRLGFRVAFEDSDTLGLTPMETDPNGRAAEEIKMVYQYTIALLNKFTSENVSHDPEKKEPRRRTVSAG